MSTQGGDEENKHGAGCPLSPSILCPTSNLPFPSCLVPTPPKDSSEETASPGRVLEVSLTPSGPWGRKHAYKYIGCVYITENYLRMYICTCTLAGWQAGRSAQDREFPSWPGVVEGCHLKSRVQVLGM